MASISQGTVVRPAATSLTGRNGLIDRYFYLAMSLLFAGIVVTGFSQTVDANLIHATPRRPILLWVHGAAFTTWVLFYMLQSVLVRTRNVKVHRLFGWFGTGLAAFMVGIGFTVAVIMTRFDVHVLHEAGVEEFLAIPFYDMAIFGTLVALAIAWRKRPELHRRLLFLATCGLLDAPFGRFQYIFNNNLYFLCLDAVILLGVGHDLLVDRKIHKVYRVALPLIWVGQAATVYLWAGKPAFWVNLTHAIVG